MVDGTGKAAYTALFGTSYSLVDCGERNRAIIKAVKVYNNGLEKVD